MLPLPTRLAAAALCGAIAGSVTPDRPLLRVVLLGAFAALVALGPALLRRVDRRRVGGPAAPRIAVGMVLAVTLLAPRAEPRPPPPSGLDATDRVVRLTGRIDGPVDVLRDPDRQDTTLRFRLRESDSRDVVLVHVDATGSTDLPRSALAPARDLPVWLPGDLVTVVGRLSAPPRPGNPGEPDLRGVGVRAEVRAWLDVRSVDGVRPASGLAGAAPSGWGRAPQVALQRVGERIRTAIGRRLDAAFRPEDAALARCLLLGDRRALAAERADAFRSAGLAHLLAVSGLHVVLLVTCGRLILDRLWPGRRRGLAGVAVLAVGLALYCAACRSGTPVVRASVFLVLGATCRAVGRRARALDLLAATVLVVLVADPGQVQEAGFQLSFAAVFGLCTLAPRLREALFPSLALFERFPEAVSPRRLAVLRHVAGATSASTAAWVATAPVLAVHFGALQPLGLVANPVAVPLAGPALWTALAGAVLGGVAPALSEGLGAIGLGALGGTADVLGALPGLEVRTPSVGPGPALLAAGLVLLGLRARTWSRRHLVPVVAAIAVLVLPGGPAQPPGPDLVALDTGHGLCVLLRGPVADGRRTDVLVDAGGLGRRVGVRRIVPALRALGVTNLAAVWVSHADSDHCGDVTTVLDRIPTGELVVPEGFGIRSAAHAVVLHARRAAIPVRRMARGRVWRRRGVTIRVLHPPAGRPGPVDNDGSLVLDVRLAGAARDAPPLRALLPGDVQFDALTALAADRTLPAVDVLLLPHHGRVAPDAARALLVRTRPRTVVSSATAATDATPDGAWVTGRDGAVRVRPGRPPEALRAPDPP